MSATHRTVTVGELMKHYHDFMTRTTHKTRLRNIEGFVQYIETHTKASRTFL